MNTTPDGAQQQKPKASTSAITPIAGVDNSVMDVLENTLWNRQLGVMSEEIVAALVCQIFEGKLCCKLVYGAGARAVGHADLPSCFDVPGMGHDTMHALLNKVLPTDALHNVVPA